MKHGTYIGSDEKLKDKTALLRRVEDNRLLVLAQFDDIDLIGRAGEALGGGWHAFDSSDFVEDGNHGK